MVVKDSLPVVPRLPRRLSSVLPVGFKHELVEFRESEASLIKELVDAKVRGEPLRVVKGSAIVRAHGCRNCPWYGSTHCFEGVFPPLVFERGICDGRLNEVVDLAMSFGTADGVLIRKRESLMRLRNHVSIFEANFADYHKKRLEELASRKLVPVDKLLKDGGLESGDLQLDDYELSLLNRIELLSAKSAEFALKEEEHQIKIDKSALSEGQGSLSLQQYNFFLNEGARELREFEEKMKEDDE